MMLANKHEVAANPLPSFGVLQSALLQVRFFKSFDVQEEFSLNDLFEESITPVLSEFESENPPNHVGFGLETDWIKAACGSLYIGIRLESNKDNSSTAVSTTSILDLFGGSDEDRSHVGEAQFWQNVRSLAPSITPQQWTNFVAEGNIPGLVVENEDFSDDGEDDPDHEEDWKPPHAECPNIYRSVVLLTLAEQLLNGTVSKGETFSGWKYDGASEKSDAIECSFVGKLKSSTWTRVEQGL